MRSTNQNQIFSESDMQSVINIFPDVFQLIKSLQKNIPNEDFHETLKEIDSFMTTLNKIPAEYIKDSELLKFIASDQYREVSNFFAALKNIQNIYSTETRKQALNEIDRLRSSLSFISLTNLYQAICAYLNEVKNFEPEQIVFLTTLSNAHFSYQEETKQEEEIKQDTEEFVTLADLELGKGPATKKNEFEAKVEIEVNEGIQQETEEFVTLAELGLSKPTPKIHEFTDKEQMEINWKITRLIKDKLEDAIINVDLECNTIKARPDSPDSFSKLLNLYDKYASLSKTPIGESLKSTTEALLVKTNFTEKTYQQMLDQLPDVSIGKVSSNSIMPFPKYLIAKSIAKSKLDGPIKARLLRKLSSKMNPDEKQRPDYIGSKTQIIKGIYREAIEKYLKDKHDEKNVTRAEELLAIINDNDKKSLFMMYEDIIKVLTATSSFLSTPYKQLKALLVNLAIDDLNLNRAKYLAIPENERIDRIVEKIYEAISVTIIVDSKPKQIRIIEHEKGNVNNSWFREPEDLWYQWGRLAALLVKYISDKDFTVQGQKTLSLGSKNDPRTIIPNTKNFAQLYSALKQLKGMCHPAPSISQDLITELESRRLPTKEQLIKKLEEPESRKLTTTELEYFNLNPTDLITFALSRMIKGIESGTLPGNKHTILMLNAVGERRDAAKKATELKEPSNENAQNSFAITPNQTSAALFTKHGKAEQGEQTSPTLSRNK